jgi:cell division protein FtsX
MRNTLLFLKRERDNLGGKGMAEEINLELKKPLDKMTAKELRQLAIEKIPQITGASGMDKDQLVKAIKEVLGMDQGEEGGSQYKTQILNLKNEIKRLREEKTATPKKDRQKRKALRRRIHILKKRTRRLAEA